MAFDPEDFSPRYAVDLLRVDLFLVFSCRSLLLPFVLSYLNPNHKRCYFLHFGNQTRDIFL